MGKGKVIPSREAAGLRCGWSKVRLTPQITGVPLAGYKARGNKRSEGIHDDLYARTIVLDNGMQRIAIVSTDLLLITRRLREAIIRQLSREGKDPVWIEPDHLLIAATHTHSGTGGYVDNWVFEFAALGPYQPEIFHQLARRIAQGVLAACRDLVPARLGLVRGLVSGMNRNRRKGGGRVDRELNVMRIDRVDGTPIAYLVNFAAHPTLLGPANLLISADFPGQLASDIEEEGPLVLFLNGPLGDQTPQRPPGYRGYELVKRYGQLLRDQVMGLTRGLKTFPSVRLGVVASEITLPPADLRAALGIFSLLLDPLVDCLFVPDRSLLQLIRIGKALLVALPCEPSAGVGLDLKKRLRDQGFSHPWIVALANDYIGYVLEEKEYQRGGYEARMSFYGPRMASWLKEGVLELAGRLWLSYPAP